MPANHDLPGGGTDDPPPNEHEPGGSSKVPAPKQTSAELAAIQAARQKAAQEAADKQARQQAADAAEAAAATAAQVAAAAAAAKEAADRQAAIATQKEIDALTDEVDTGAKNRLVMTVPATNSRIVVGSSLDTAAAVASYGYWNGVGSYNGVNFITDKHFFTWAKGGTATLQSSGQMLLQSIGGGASLLAQGDVLVGSTNRDTAVGASGNVRIVSGLAPSITQLSPGVTADPAAVTPQDYTDVSHRYKEGTIVTTATLGMLTGAMGLVLNTAAVEVGSIVAYVLQTIGTLGAMVTLGTTPSAKDEDDGKVLIHGKDGVITTAGMGSSIFNMADTGSITSVGGITAGMVGGVAASMFGGLAATVTGLGKAGLSSLLGASIDSLMYAGVNARLGKATVQAPEIQIGKTTTVWPQWPTISVKTNALATVREAVGLLEDTSLTLTSFVGAKLRSGMKVAMEVALPTAGPFLPGAEALPIASVSASLTGVKITAGPPGAPAALDATLTDTTITGGVLAKVRLSVSAATTSYAASSVRVDPTGVTIAGPLIKIG